MPEIELSAGVVEYQDTGGKGPVLVFLHGLLMDGTVWRKVVADLRLARELREFVKISPVAANDHIVSSGPPGFERGRPE